ncbi:MAG: sugar transferase [Bacteroidia bacterium]|nr:MAG: sugar transferase [Bacteroidia bacterium]
MKERRLKLLYITSDILFSVVAWSLFFFFRKLAIEKKIFGEELIISADRNMYVGMILIPLFWFLIYFIVGSYNQPLRKSRLKELGETFLVTLGGTMFLFFALILDDQIIEYTNYYLSFLVLFVLQFFLCYIPRFLLTTRTVHMVQSGRVGFNTIIIGGNGRAIDIYNKISMQRRSTGNIFIGYIPVNNDRESGLEDHLPALGSLDDLSSIIVGHRIKEIIIAIEYSETKILGNIINMIGYSNVVVKSISGTHDILFGRVKMSTIFGTPLAVLNESPIQAWQYNLKVLVDYASSAFALILTIPLSLALAVAIRAESRGPVIFKQLRVGKNGKYFYIYKFRSMHNGAEDGVPRLSSDDDSRVTPIGRYMRKHRLDEIPNFINVLKGEMSIVGPRPERPYYIDQIVKRAPEYNHLLRIKPGITSWGQVKYGYASDVDQMINRLEYDLLYLENMSLYVDLKIIIYTIITVLKGRGV